MKFTLKELRARKGLTQEDVAHALGVHLNTYRSWEQNPGMIQISKVYAIAELFGVRLDDIFLGLNTMSDEVRNDRS